MAAPEFSVDVFHNGYLPAGGRKLLGLIREGDGVAAQVLVKLGADLNWARQQVIQLLAAAPPTGVIATSEVQFGLSAVERRAGIGPATADLDRPQWGAGPPDLPSLAGAGRAGPPAQRGDRATPRTAPRARPQTGRGHLMRGQ
jgi:hypothetical protein